METLLSVLFLAVAFGLPAVIVVVSRRRFGLRFRFAGPLAVGVTTLALTLYGVLLVLPMMERALEEAGEVADTDGYVLGAMVSGLFWAVIGTVPWALGHALRKRREAQAGKVRAS